MTEEIGVTFKHKIGDKVAYMRNGWVFNLIDYPSPLTVRRTTTSPVFNEPYYYLDERYRGMAIKEEYLIPFDEVISKLEEHIEQCLALLSKFKRETQNELKTYNDRYKADGFEMEISDDVICLNVVNDYGIEHEICRIAMLPNEPKNKPYFLMFSDGRCRISRPGPIQDFLNYGMAILQDTEGVKK